MKLSELLDIGMSVKPKALTEKEITRFYYSNRYKDNFQELWDAKLERFKKKWGKIYLYNKIVSYPRLKISWKIKDGKFHITHSIVNSSNLFPCLTILPNSEKEKLEQKIKSLCRFYHCKYEHFELSDAGCFVFMSLEELAS